MKGVNIIATFVTACKVRLYHIRQFIRNCIYYYLWNPKFFCADMLCLFQYFWQSPFRMIRRHDEKNPDNPLGPYGETDFYLFDTLLHRFRISRDLTFAELGSGRSRLAMWLAMVRGQAKVYAVEQYGPMVERAKRVKRWLGVKNVEFVQANWEELAFSDVDLFYLYLPVESDDQLREVGKTTCRLKSGTRIITIGWWFGEVMPEKFMLEGKTKIRFDWGPTEAYLQTIL